MRMWWVRLGQSTPERVLRAALLLILFLIPVSLLVILDLSQAVVTSRYNQFAVPTFYGVEGLIVVTLAGWWQLRRPTARSLKPFRWLVPAVAVAGLSALWAPSPGLAIITAIHLLMALGLLVMLSREFRDAAFLKMAAWTVTSAAVIQVLIGFDQFVTGYDLGLRVLGEPMLSLAQSNVAKVGDHLRAYGTFPHPNLLAAFLAIAIFWVGTVIFWPFERGGQDLPRLTVTGIVLSLLGIGLLLTFSRTALVIVAINGTLVVVFSYLRWRRLPLVAGLTALAVGIAALGLIGQLADRTRLESSRETGVSNRTIGYELAGRMILERPYGVGAGNFVLVAPELRTIPSYQYQPAHNAPLLAFAEVGVIPALLLVTFVIRVGTRFHFYQPKNPRENTLNFSLFALSGVLIALGMTDHFLWSLPQGLWITVVVLATVTARIPERRFQTV